MRRRQSTICTARSANCRSNGIFLPGSPPSPDCCEAGEAGQRFQRRKPMEWPDEGMIAPNAALSISRQCMLLGIARSSFYYQPRPLSAVELDLLNRLDRIFTEHPVCGSRRLQVALLREGVSVGRRRIRRLMRKLGLAAVRPKRTTSKPHPEHKVYPYLLRDKTINQPNQVWSADI